MLYKHKLEFNYLLTYMPLRIHNEHCLHKFAKPIYYFRNIYILLGADNTSETSLGVLRLVEKP